MNIDEVEKAGEEAASRWKAWKIGEAAIELKHAYKQGYIRALQDIQSIRQRITGDNNLKDLFGPFQGVADNADAQGDVGSAWVNEDGEPVAPLEEKKK